MNNTTESLADITENAIRLLCEELGPVNTARFLNQFSLGSGDYTRDRDELIGNATVDELVAEIKEMRKAGRRSAKPRRKKR